MGPKLVWLSKTVWVNVLTFLVAVFGLLQGQDWIASNPQWVAIIGAVVGVLNVLIRFVTHQPLTLTKR